MGIGIVDGNWLSVYKSLEYGKLSVYADDYVFGMSLLKEVSLTLIIFHLL